MALAEAGLLAARVNDGSELVLIVKLSTDTLKWIHGGAAVRLVICHVQVDEFVIRCVGLEILDCPSDPVLLSQPQFDEEEVRRFDELLSNSRFAVHFYNEQPFISVLDSQASLATESLSRYNRERQAESLYVVDKPNDRFRRAQELFEHSVLPNPVSTENPSQVFRFNLNLHFHHWNTITIPGSPTFDPSGADEGRSNEHLVMQTLKPHFDGSVLLSPHFSEGKGSREFCDVFAWSADHAFVFETKAFSVFDKTFAQSLDRRARTVEKDISKALKQLTGAMRQLDQGVELFGDGLSPAHFSLRDFASVHGIAVVSNTTFSLPWRAIGARLAELQRPPHKFFHVVTVMELQQMVAFTSGNPKELDRLLQRRAEVVSSSGNANIRTSYLPEPSSDLRMPTVPGENCAARFAIEGKAANTKVVTEMLNVLLGLLERRRFSGRCEIHHEVTVREGKALYWLGIAVGSVAQMTCAPDREWWSAFIKDFCAEANKRSLPLPLRGTPRCLSVAKLREQFPDVLMVVECSEGHVSARRMGEKK